MNPTIVMTNMSIRRTHQVIMGIFIVYIVPWLEKGGPAVDEERWISVSLCGR